MNRISRRAFGLALAAGLVAPLIGIAHPAAAADAKKKIVMIAGTPSHGPGDHEFNAGVQLLKKCLDQGAPNVEATYHLNGWPADPHAFDGADAVVLYMDGGGGHPAIQDDHLQVLEKLMAKGVGLGCYHYAVEVPKEKGGPEFLKWIGGYYETGYSINPVWKAELTLAKDHPITRGVKPFTISDEWYYTIRFREDMAGVTPILSGTPPDITRKTDAAKARAGKSEDVAWAVERPDGGRGFGFTGAHFHRNWGNDDFRKLVLNSMLWVAKTDVPAGGVESVVTPEELKLNLDPKGLKK